MKILQAHLCNFKNYCGNHSINLSPDSEGIKNLILIGGLNGTGKTTLFEAIKLCLFGIQFEGKPLAKTRYDKYILSAKNKKSTKNGDNSFFVSITLQLDDVFPTYSIDLKREWQFEKNQVNERFIISRNSYPLEIVEQEYWQDYITSLIPPYITDYFFFDGERMKELTVGDKAEIILRESARDLMGLKLYETLINDISSLERKIIKKSENNEKSRQEIEDLEREINLKDRENNEIISKIFSLEEKVVQLKTKKNEIEFELQRKSGSLAKERENKEKEIHILKEDIETLSTQITDICDYIPFFICNKLVKKTIKKLKEEKKFKEILSNRHLLKEIDGKINERFAEIEREIPQEHIEYVKTQINEIIKDIENEYNLDAENPVVHDITNESFQKIIQFLDKIDSKVKSQFKKYLHDQEGYEFRIKKLESELKSIPDDVLVHEEISLINQIDSQLGIIEREKNELAIQKGVIESLSKPLLIKMEKIEYSSLKTQEDTLKVITCQKVTRSLKQFVDLILSSKINELENYIILMHKKLSNKDDLIANIEINPKSFEISIYDDKGVKITKEFLSAGEKEIFALSILWGLSKLSKSKLPVIVDSLLARLDTKHVYQVAKEFLPNAGDQVIILSHDREVDEKMYKKLKPNLNKNYILSFDQENKISEGYFFTEGLNVVK